MKVLKKVKRLSFLLMLTFGVIVSSFAQGIDDFNSLGTRNLSAYPLPYFCDFESQNYTNWGFQNGPYENRWIIASNLEANNTVNGESALYVSNNNIVPGTIGGFGYNGRSSSAVWAYFDVNVVGYRGVSITFDCNVGGDRWDDYLQVFAGPPTDNLQTTYNYTYNSSEDTPNSATFLGKIYKTNGWKTIAYDVDVPMGTSNVRVYFFWKNYGYSGTQPSAAIDNIKVNGRTCPIPSRLSATSGDSYIDLSFHAEEASQWDVAIRSRVDSIWPFYGVDYTHRHPVDNNDEIFDIITITDTLHQLTDLIPDTYYDVFVRSKCNAGDTTVWVGPLTVRTECTDYMEIPYFNNFDSYQVVPTEYASSSPTYVEPTCWKSVNTAPPSWGDDLTVYPYTAASNTYSLWINENVYAIAPQVNVVNYAMDGLKVKFKINRNRIYGLPQDTILQIGVMSNPNDISTFEVVSTMRGEDFPENDPTTSQVNYEDWIEVEQSLENYRGMGSYITIKVNDDAYIDDFSVTSTRPNVPRPEYTFYQGCGISIITMSAAPPVASHQVRWYRNGQLVHTGTSYTGTFTQNEIVVCKSYDAACDCESNPISIQVHIVPKPTMPTLTVDSVCVGNTAYFEVFTAAASSADAVVSYVWFSEHNQPLDTTDVYNSGWSMYTIPNITEDMTILVEGVNREGCRSERASATVHVKEVPTIVVTPYPSQVCAGTPITLQATVSEGATCQWMDRYQNSHVGTQFEFQSSDIGENWVGVYAEKDGCTSYEEVIIEVTAPLAIPLLEVYDVEVCGSGSAQFSIDNPNPNYTYLWYDNLQGNPIAQGVNFATGVQNTSKTYYVYAQTENCLSEGPAQCHLAVYPIHYFDTTIVNVCETDMPYTSEGNVYSASGTYKDTIPSPNGCFISVLILNVEQQINEATTITVCENELPYVWRGGRYFESGVYTDTEQTNAGCVNTYTLNLTVTQSFVMMYEPISVCEMDLPYEWRGRQITAAGTYYDSLHTIHGCDSVYILDFSLLPTSVDTQRVWVCSSNLPYDFHGKMLTTAGTYKDTISSPNGCFISVLILNVEQQINETTTITICENELPYVWRGGRYSESGVYTDTEQTNADCEHTYTLNLTVANTYSIRDYASACAMELPYEWRGRQITAAGIYYDSLRTIHGCDSVYILDFSLLPTSVDTSNLVVCIDDLPYEYNGVFYNEAGTYTDTMSTPNGCALKTLVLEVGMPILENDTMVVCQNELPYIWHGQELVQSGVYRVEELNNNGCEDVYVLNLQVLPSYEESESVFICELDLPYIWRGRVFSEEGHYYDSLLTNQGCDSVYELRLSVMSVVKDTILETVCRYSLPYVYNGEFYTAAGVYSDTISNEYECRIETLVLSIQEPSVGYEEIEVCQSDLPYMWRGKTLWTAGVYSDTISTEQECRIDMLTLSVQVPPIDYEEVMICQNDLPYMWHGRTLWTAGVYSDTLLTTYCGSISVLTLSVASNYFEMDTIELCANELPYIWNGMALNTAGVYYDSLETVYGCDSVKALTLIVNQLNNTIIRDVVCQNEPYEGYGFSISPMLTANVGEYVDTLSFTSLVTGCDSLVILHLEILPLPNVSITASTDQVLLGETISLYASGAVSYIWTTGDVGSHIEVTINETDIIAVVGTDENGCMGTNAINIVVVGIEDVDETQFTFYPNPVQSVLNIYGEMMKEVYLYAINGQLLSRIATDDPSFVSINMENYPPAQYVIHLKLSDGSTIAKKIIVSSK